MDINAKIKEVMANPVARTAIIVVASILALFLLLGIVDAALLASKVHRGVTVDGENIGGMNKKEALSKVDGLAGVIENKTISVNYKSNVWKINLQELNVRVDREKTVQNAFDIGRKGGARKAVRDRISLWFKSRDISPVLTFDKESLDLIISKIAKTIDIPAKDAKIKIINGRVAVTDNKDGLKVDKDYLARQISKMMMSQNNNVAITVKVVKPDITKDHIEKAKNSVAGIVKYPIVLKYHDNKWDVSVQRIADWIDFVKTRDGTHWSLNVTLDKNEIKAYLDEITKGLVTEPKDAQFKIEDNDKVTIIPSSDGSKIDIDKAYNDILDSSKSSDNREVLLSTTAAKAKLSTDDAEKMGIKDKVTSFTTFFNPAQAPRVHNIQLLGGTLDGTIVAPNEVFSFNKTIGPRTAEKGYQEAPAIMDGKLVPELGGGVCQVGTTLFNTIFFGGYEVVERHNHSFFISHYPLGRDATVSYGGPDLKFKNDSPAYILMKVKTTASSITISFYSTSENVKVDYTTAGPYNFKDLSSQTVQDPTLPSGVTKKDEDGFSGRDVSVNRTVSKNGKEVRKDTFFSRYLPKRTVIRVGTGTAVDVVESSATPVQ